MYLFCKYCCRLINYIPYKLHYKHTPKAYNYFEVFRFFRNEKKYWIFVYVCIIIFLTSWHWQYLHWWKGSVDLTTKGIFLHELVIAESPAGLSLTLKCPFDIPMFMPSMPLPIEIQAFFYFVSLPYLTSHVIIWQKKKIEKIEIFQTVRKSLMYPFLNIPIFF